MADKTDKPEARLTTEPCGELGIWIYIDGELMDLIHYADLKHAVDQKTKDGIQMIYDDFRAAKGLDEE